MTIHFVSQYWPKSKLSPRMLCFDLHHNIDSKHKLSQRMLCFSLLHKIDQRANCHQECFFILPNNRPRLSILYNESTRTSHTSRNFEFTHKFLAMLEKLYLFLWWQYHLLYSLQCLFSLSVIYLLAVVCLPARVLWATPVFFFLHLSLQPLAAFSF